MSEEERLAEYRQCQKRGHVAASFVTQGMGPTKGICKYCLTLFWEETVGHEENRPAFDTPDFVTPAINTNAAPGHRYLQQFKDY